MREPETYGEAVQYLESLPLFTKKTDPEGIIRLLDALGHPEKDYRLIHVAGTNGKGSTCAFLESVFRGMGLKTGLFTSPHLVRTNERIRIQGRMIEDHDFLESFFRVRRAVEECRKAGGQEPTYFEYLYAMALCSFRKHGIDLLVCETGVGGRLDATNTIARADAVVITSISLDHTKYLGETVEKIAGEKAGIIRDRTPVIYSAKDPRSARVIALRAEEKRAEQIPLTEDMFTITGRGSGYIEVILTPEQEKALTLHVPFEAEYQAENASLAALCALRLGAGEEAVREGIAKTRWPGRMEEIRKDVFLDGAHNPDGIRNIAREIRRAAETRKVRLLCAIVSDKNHAQMVQELCCGIHYDSVIVTSIGGSRQLSVGELAEEFRNAGQSPVEEEADAKKAYEKALREKEGSVLFCVGSLYLIGEILEAEAAG